MLASLVSVAQAARLAALKLCDVPVLETNLLVEEGRGVAEGARVLPEARQVVLYGTVDELLPATDSQEGARQIHVPARVLGGTVASWSGRLGARWPPGSPLLRRLVPRRHTPLASNRRNKVP